MKKPIVLSNSILKVAPFQIGFASLMVHVLQMVNFPEVNPGGNIVILAYVPL